MCRLFLSINTKNIKKKIILFLLQSIHSKKFTPLLNNDMDSITHKDGYGLSWFKNNKIYIYKSPLLFIKDTNFNNILNNISGNIVLGHIRKKTESKSCYDNTHPFYFNNNIFMHNGKIRGFNKNKHIIIKNINLNYLSFIKGYTDSEILFFLYLTFLDIFPNQYKKAMFEMFNLFKILNIELIANIIYANKDYIIVTRYLIYNQNKYIYKQIPPSLYIDFSNGVIISSEPLTNNWKLIKENSILLIDIKNSNII
jgi:predicted glutamine amidotransferase